MKAHFEAYAQIFDVKKIEKSSKIDFWYPVKAWKLFTLNYILLLVVSEIGNKINLQIWK